MAIDLKAVFRVQDKGSSQLRKLTKSMEQIDRASKNVSKSTTSSGNAIKSLGSTASSAAGGVGRLKSSMSGMVGAVAGVAGAYLTAQGAIKAFNATVGAAAKLEQQEVVTRTMFQDDGKAAEYSKMVKQMALDSAVLNSGDMAYGSKAFVGLTKDLDQLREIWKVTEKLQAFSGVDTAQASFSFKELLQGDYVSIVDAIGLDKKSMQKITKLDTVEKKIAAITAELDKMGVTDKTLEDMSNTTLGRWSAITEKVQSFFTAIGQEPNGTLNKLLSDIQTKLEGIDMTSLANKIGSGMTTAFNTAVDAITFVKDNMDEFKGVLKFVKEGVITLTAAFVAHKAILAGMAIYSTITTLIAAYRAGTLLATASQLLFNGALTANPIGLVVAAIAGLIGIIVLLVRNWETVTATVKRTWKAIGGGSGAIALILGPLGFLINAAIDLAKNWDSTRSVWENVWSAIQRSAATSINAVIGLINSMIETINKIPGVNIPIVAKVNWGSATAGSDAVFNSRSTGPVRGYYHGLDNVPYDRMPAYLHRGEKVLPAQEAKEYRTAKAKGNGGFGGGITINMHGTTIREDADIDKIGMALAKAIESEMLQRG